MSVTVKGNTYIYLSILLFLIPLPWLCAWLLAAIFHEICHLIAVKLCGGTISGLTISVGGIQMECVPMSRTKCAFAILSGPIGGFGLLLFHRVYPHLAICTWLLSVYNLLPVYPLDGGRLLQIIIKDSVLFDKMQKIIITTLLLFAVYAFYWLHFSLYPLMIAAILLYKHRKTPCKTDACRVQ